MTTARPISRRQLLRSAGGAAAAGLLPSGLRAQLKRPMGDVIVVLPGIMGSVLQKDGRDVWALSGSAFFNALRTLGGSVGSLTLSGDSAEAESLDDGITATSIFPDTHLIPGFWKIDGYSTLAKTLTDAFDVRRGENYHEFAYDWRRDNRAAARRLARLAPTWLAQWRSRSGNPQAKLILIAHSMGGLVSRYFLESLGGWRDTRMLITFGTPYRGSLNALDFIANGLKKNVGIFGSIDLSSLIRSFTSTYQLLPIYPCFDAGDGRLQRITETRIANVDRTRAENALGFHNEIRAANERNERDPSYADRYALHPLIGTDQRTSQVARRDGGSLVMLDAHPTEIVTGDGTVPAASATPIESAALTSRHHSVFVSDLHGSLQNSTPMLDHLKALLARVSLNDSAFRADRGERLSLSLDDLYATTENVVVRVGALERAARVTVTISDVTTGRVGPPQRVTLSANSTQTVDFGALPEALYRVRALGDGGGSATDVCLVARA